ncbi:two-component regulator propeller domain-containing protein [Niabella hibiscisoli]|uniref:two-component regulator propeller domain-containing protein n=1 Tax=Niabella hibiscisoli TaxID=1825928 RepID=UPI001F1145BB|nr:two-component regulator propeller domain-containing protein [Niabella hibiscisoli]MCH5718331.1 hypothetical protein [Niabella hibiscisoli]
MYASSYAGKLYEIDMFTLSVLEIALPKPAASEATVFVIMNVIDEKLYLSRAQGAFIILDLKKNNKPILISNSDYSFRYLIHGDLSTPDFRHLGIWVKVLNDKLFIRGNIYRVHNKKLDIFYTTGRENEKLKTVSSYLEDGSELYVGFLESGGLVKYNSYNARSVMNPAETLLPDVEVGDILKDSRGNIWVSTLHHGVFLFLVNKKNTKIIHSV